MKALKAIMAVAMIMVLACCGGKNESEEKAENTFSIKEADTLCDKYFADETFTEKQWNEFGDMYVKMCDHEVKILKDIIKKAGKDASMSEISELVDTDPKLTEFFQVKFKVTDIASSSDIPDNVREKIESANTKLNAEEQKIFSELM